MPKTHTERLWVLGGVIVALLMVFIGYTMFVSPQNSSTSTAQSEVSSANAANQRLQARINALRVQSKSLAQYQSDLRVAELALPSTSGLPDFLRTLQSIGNATRANVSSLTVGVPADVTGVAGASTSTGGASTSTSSVARTSGLRVYALPITASVTGTTSELDQFLTQLQSVQPRAVLISQLTEGALVASGSSALGTVGSSLQLTMQAFVAPSDAAESARLSSASGK
jgi:Tfp pilus assembly protein PilO